ncbi:MAG: TonB-dependent receptor [Flammeovirgaceae bacterium]
MVGATVVLMQPKDSTEKFVKITDPEGKFEFKNLKKKFYILKISYVGYDDIVRRIIFEKPEIDLGILWISPNSKMLNQVEVIGKAPLAIQKGDTTEMSASAYKTDKNASVEELIKKTPTVTVENGVIKAQGENVGKVMIDGKEYFGEDASMALKNLPADVVDKIQVYDRMSDQSRFTGFDDGNSVKTINIITKSDKKNAQFGKIYAGYGTDERYLVGGNVNFFNGNRRIALIGMSNNLNIQNFSAQDLVGLTNSTGQGRGGGGGMGGRGNRNNPANNFLVGQQNGIATTHSFGVNYNDIWAKNINIGTSYFFNFSEINNTQEMNRNYFLSRVANQTYQQNSLTNIDNQNHRLNVRLEYKIDSFNTIILTPRLSFQGNLNNALSKAQTNLENGAKLNASENKQKIDSWAYNFVNDLLWQHAFPKRGRTISINLNTQINDRDNHTKLTAYNFYYLPLRVISDTLNQYTDQITEGLTVGSNIAYTEPLGKNSLLQVDYNVSKNKNISERKTYEWDLGNESFPLLDSLLSNEFDNQYLSQRVGASYRLNKNKKMNLAFGLAYQNAVLKGEQSFPDAMPTISRKFNNILPNAMLRYNFSESSNLRIFYRTSTNAPSVTQLQNVIDNTNPLLLVAGNPSLKQEYSHFAVMRYSFNNTAKSTSFFAFANVNHIRNYIGNTTLIAETNTPLANGIILNRGSQLITPDNLNGFWSVRSFLVYGFPITKLKLNVSLNGGITYNRLPSLINKKQNYSNSYVYNQGVTISSNISEKIDFSLGYVSNYNVVKNTLQPELDNNFFFHTISFRSNVIFGKGFLWQNEMYHTLYAGLADGFNRDFLLWTLSFGKKIFKDQNGEIKVSVFDVLNQNNNINRTVTEAYIEDIQNRVLKQYYMLTFTYYLKPFRSKD